MKLVHFLRGDFSRTTKARGNRKLRFVTEKLQFLKVTICKKKVTIFKSYDFVTESYFFVYYVISGAEMLHYSILLQNRKSGKSKDVEARSFARA